MILINSDANLILETHPYKKIELVGRTCYKSEDKITDDSCFKFVEGLAKRQHLAMLEHARFTFAISNIDPFIHQLLGVPGIVYKDYVKMYSSKTEYKDVALLGVSMSHLYNPKWKELRPLFDCMKDIVIRKYIEKDPSVDGWVKMPIYSPELRLMSESEVRQYPEFNFLTIKFTCDRGVSHELVRHRCSVAQESTRYCNYAKEQFGNQITFIKPANYDEWDDTSRLIYEDCLHVCESTYMDLINIGGKTPQQARAILPNSTKTDCILTMSVDHWNHFFALRSYGTTGAPHPDMKVVADIALEKAKAYSSEIV